MGAPDNVPNRVSEAQRVELVILDVLTNAEAPLTSGQIFQKDTRLTDKKAVTNALTRLKDSGEVIHDGSGYIIGTGVGGDHTRQSNPTERALSLLGRQSFGVGEVAHFAAKVQCLHRLEQLMEPHIGRLLRLVREDLERYNALSSGSSTPAGDDHE